MDDLKKRSVMELLGLYVDIMQELRCREVIRSDNIPTGDLAERLFCRAFSWRQAPKSEKAFDAEDSTGNRFQIKGRRHTRRNKSRQLSQIRDLDEFHTLAAVLFDERFSVERAALIPNEIVRKRVTRVARTNSFRFMLTDDVWDDKRVIGCNRKVADCRTAQEFGRREKHHDTRSPDDRPQGSLEGRNAGEAGPRPSAKPQPRLTTGPRWKARCQAIEVTVAGDCVRRTG